MPAVNHDRYDDLYLRQILRDTRTIAMVGASANWNRPSYFAMKYLLDRGYEIIPVNPAAAGQQILGRKVYGSLAELPKKADMVDIFRNSEAAGPITDALEPVNTEFRDDRFTAAFDRKSGDASVFTVAYVARAVSLGKYVRPQASVEDMYRPDRYGRSATGNVEVTAAK